MTVPSITYGEVVEHGVDLGDTHVVAIDIGASRRLIGCKATDDADAVEQAGDIRDYFMDLYRSAVISIGYVRKVES